MSRITVDLLRKRSEHNEGIISSLEEISLHQEELIAIEVIGTLCRKLKILYLQNNIIEKIEDLTHMKDLEYLNLALNNIKKIEGLENCEFLKKLDLTVNFIDFDTLEESLIHLQPLTNLKELYLLGNPCQSNWDAHDFTPYVIAMLPQLQSLDGKAITRTDRILANQRLKELKIQLNERASNVHEQAKEADKEWETKEEEDIIDIVPGRGTDISEPASDAQTKAEEKCPYTPETRREMYVELAEQKAEKEARERENAPRERNTEAEHAEALDRARAEDQSSSSSIRQCNEGKFEFRIDDDENPECVVIQVELPKYLDSSLVEVDAHPHHVTITIKNKILRLRFPEECYCDRGTAERSKTTGALRLAFPKVDEKSIARSMRRQQAMREPENAGPGSQNIRKPARDTKVRTLQETMQEASKAVKVRGIVQQNDDDSSDDHGNWTLTPVLTKATNEREYSHVVDPLEDDDPPPLF